MVSNLIGWGLNTNSYLPPQGMRGNNPSNYSYQSAYGANQYGFGSSIFGAGGCNSTTIIQNYQSSNPYFGSYGGTGVDNIFDYTMALCAQTEAVSNMLQPILQMRQQQAADNSIMQMYGALLGQFLATNQMSNTQQGTHIIDTITDNTGQTQIPEDQIIYEETVTKDKSSPLAITGAAIGGVAGATAGIVGATVGFGAAASMATVTGVGGAATVIGAGLAAGGAGAVAATAGAAIVGAAAGAAACYVIGESVVGAVEGAVELGKKWGDKAPVIGHIAGGVVGAVGGAVKGTVKGVKKVGKAVKKAWKKIFG